MTMFKTYLEVLQGNIFGEESSKDQVQSFRLRDSLLRHSKKKEPDITLKARGWEPSRQLKSNSRILPPGRSHTRHKRSLCRRLVSCRSQ